MKAARELRSGKGHKDENFPVASFVIEARHRSLILAFYEFVRIADDISDHATLSPAEKLSQLDRLGAEPVGRFVLDVHGESRATWAASDALCAALQINNHMQDCGKDFRSLDRVYIPQDTMQATGMPVD